MHGKCTFREKFIGAKRFGKPIQFNTINVNIFLFMVKFAVCGVYIKSKVINSAKVSLNVEMRFICRSYHMQL